MDARFVHSAEVYTKEPGPTASSRGPVGGRVRIFQKNFSLEQVCGSTAALVDIYIYSCRRRSYSTNARIGRVKKSNNNNGRTGPRVLIPILKFFFIHQHTRARARTLL